MKTFKTFINENTEKLTTKDQVKDWLDEMGVEKYTINSDLTVDVNGDVDLYDKNLTNIPVQFNNVKGNFNCSSNKIVSLQGSPLKISGYFSCTHNYLSSLEGSPKEISGDFSCTHNYLLSLKGAPKSVFGDFNCSYNRITSLEYLPEYISGDLYCNHNHIKDYTISGKVNGKIFK